MAAGALIAISQRVQMLAGVRAESGDNVGVEMRPPIAVNAFAEMGIPVFLAGRAAFGHGAETARFQAMGNLGRVDPGAEKF